MPLNVKPLETLSAVRVGLVAGWGDQVAGEKVFQSMPVTALSMRFASSSSNPPAVPTGPANATTCQPTTSAAMAPIANNNIVRLLTTHSPYLLTSAPVAEPMHMRPSSLPLGPQSSEPIVLFSLQHLLSLPASLVSGGSG